MAESPIDLLELVAKGTVSGGEESSHADILSACASRLAVRPKDLELYRLKRVHKSQGSAKIRSKVAVLVKKKGEAKESGVLSLDLAHNGIPQTTSSYSLDPDTSVSAQSEVMAENDFLQDKIESLKEALLAFQDVNQKLQAELTKTEEAKGRLSEQVRQLTGDAKKERKEAQHWKKKYERIHASSSPRTPTRTPPSLRKNSHSSSDLPTVSSHTQRRASVAAEPTSAPGANMQCRMCACAQFVARPDVRWICGTCQHTVVKHVQRASPDVSFDLGPYAGAPYSMSSMRSRGRVAMIGGSGRSPESFPRRSVSAPKTAKTKYSAEEIFARP